MSIIRRWPWKLILCLYSAVYAAELKTPALENSDHKPELIEYRLIGTYPHDTDAATQGLTYFDGFLYESTGLFGASSIRKTELSSGALSSIRHLDRRFFGEGITVYESSIYQLTWRAGTGFVYDMDLKQKGRNFYYSGEGWGLTHNGREFIKSDGSSRLQFLNSSTLKPVRELRVIDETGPVMRLNELEYINNQIYANILYDSRIARIDASSGRITGWLNLESLIAHNQSVSREENREPGALNGIAWDPHNKRLFVTGKFWPNIYELQLVDNTSE